MLPPVLARSLAAYFSRKLAAVSPAVSRSPAGVSMLSGSAAYNFSSRASSSQRLPMIGAPRLKSSARISERRRSLTLRWAMSCSGQRGLSRPHALSCRRSLGSCGLRSRTATSSSTARSRRPFPRVRHASICPSSNPLSSLLPPPRPPPLCTS
eukprot:scaffold54964_cov30-Tisochrysis_lutea.AAC.11